MAKGIPYDRDTNTIVVPKRQHYKGNYSTITVMVRADSMQMVPHGTGYGSSRTIDR